MVPIRAIYRDGVFRPTDPVDLPDGAEVIVQPSVVPARDVRVDARRRVYGILSRNYDGGDPFVAQNHNEHRS